MIAHGRGRRLLSRKAELPHSRRTRPGAPDLRNRRDRAPQRSRRRLPYLLGGAGAVVVGSPRPILAHPGQPIEPHDLWTAWNLDPWILLLIGSAVWLYARGAGAVWRRAGRGAGVPRWRFACFTAGMTVLALALLSPLDALGASLFSAHMVQHELLVLVAAPLIVLGTPLVAWIWALPPRLRHGAARMARLEPVRVAWRAISYPAVAWTLHAAAIWIWHLPALYQSTLGNEAVHLAQHASFFGSAVLFWWVVLGPSGTRSRAGSSVVYLFTTAVHGSALGALLTFSSRPWYPLYSPRVQVWGLTPLEDQQLGGLIMWIPFGTLYTFAALALFAVFLRRAERPERGTAAAGAAG